MSYYSFYILKQEYLFYFFNDWFNKVSYCTVVREQLYTAEHG